MRNFIITIFVVSLQFAQPNYPKSYDKAQFIFDDVALFISVYEELNENSDTLHLLQTKYLDKGSMGLKEFMNRFDLNAKTLKQAIAENKNQYDKVANFYENKDEVIKKIKAAYSKLQNVVPNAMFPPTYFIVGRYRGIGQASRYGQLLSITKIIEELDFIERLAVHELAHFQNAMALGIQNYQAIYRKKDNMLDVCIREGIAEFITYLSLDKITQEKSLEYYNSKSETLKHQFNDDLKNQKSAYWLYESLDKKDQPKLLGYVLGFKICESYYSAAENKEKAIQTLLTLKDVDTFYKKLEF